VKEHAVWHRVLQKCVTWYASMCCYVRLRFLLKYLF